MDGIDGIGERQTSTTEMLPDKHASHLGDVIVPGQLQLSTVVPIREEFRCRRWWFFYHDIRAFTTSWLPLPVFLIYRVLVFLYLLAWLILHIYFRHEEFGPHWLIFISNLGFALLTVSMGAVTILCAVYGIAYHTRRERLVHHLPKKDFPLARVYKQDNIPWYIKIIWCLYIVANSTAFVIFFGYWMFVYSPCEDSNAEMGGSGTALKEGVDSDNGSSSGSGEIAAVGSCGGIDAATVHVHGVNVAVILIDLFLSRVPYQFLHLFHSMIFTVIYVIFTVIYYVAGGTNSLGDPYIYSTLDYGNSPALSVGFIILITAACIPIHLGLFLLAWLRDVIAAKSGCCFRDVRRHPFRESREETNHHNGEIVTDEITKV